MPRGPRIDIEGAVYHVIGRGVERRAIFRNDGDRRDFLKRLAELSGAEDITLFAYVLMNNHFHLVVRRGIRLLGGFMRRLLTGYSTAFNLRHRRSGHLFQNRYQAVLCDAEEYLLTLVRYVHLNPVRAGMVADPGAYAWSSHAAYLQRRPPACLDTQTVLAVVGGKAAYRRFVTEGLSEGKRSELCGRISGRSDGAGSGLWLGGQLLGSEGFARGMVKRARGKEARRLLELGRAEELPELVAGVSKRLKVAEVVLCGAGRSAAVSRSRREVIRVAVLQRGIRPVEVSRYLGISTAAVAQQLRRLEESA
ncbi:MAG: transposase [Deltaproteobacteria bacterium]|nr:transposase [Deltaproteobacteria bacterium]